MRLPHLSPESKLIVSLSGGKDSVATLLTALELFDPEHVLAHHQIIMEDWPGTTDYCQRVCDHLGVPLYMTQARYHGYECSGCQNRYLSARSLPYCRACGCREATFIRMVESVLDLVEWRQKWPSLSVRFCTSYLKRDHFNAWARANASWLGSHPVVALGERAHESPTRAKLPALRFRSGLKEQWMQEWRPILDLKRIEVFRKIRAYGIEPHYCYKAQWRELLRPLYPEATEEELERRVDHEMYEVDQEGGPRMSCVMCFLKSAEQLKASYQVAAGRAILERGIQVERMVGHTIKYGQSLEQVLAQ